MAQKAHCIGIAGKGMSATALLLRQKGWEISGSDEGFYPPVSDYLAEAKIPFAAGYKKENIPPDVDMIVIGKNAKLTPETNEEVKAAFESGTPVKSFPEVLEDLTASTDNLVVAGSYGKSTSTALLAWCLRAAGKDPSYFIGEITKGFDAHAGLGGGGVFVLEGDEYPSANWDPRSKFLHYNPHSVLLTSATHDHLNIFPTHDEYLAAFKALLVALPPNGLLVVNGGERYARALSEGFGGKKVFYNIPEGWHADHVAFGMPTTFNLMRGQERVVTLTTPLLGAHNVENIVGISALLLEKRLLTPEELASGVATFEGVKRRMESLAPRSSVPIYEGFGSSYEKARAAIAAMRLHFPTRRLVVVFEPHTFTWRNRGALSHYNDVFEGASKVYIYEPATQGASTHAQLSQQEIVEHVRTKGFDAEAITNPSDALKTITSSLQPTDCILLLTSGDLGGLIKSLPASVEGKFPS
jgi:UDP-N-acetylmuramate: L-alanyl-gamma-D-glutamyl-meso-diaminopimelate ligase